MHIAVVSIADTLLSTWFFARDDFHFEEFLLERFLQKVFLRERHQEEVTKSTPVVIKDVVSFEEHGFV